MEKMTLPFRFTTNIVSFIGHFLVEARYIPSMAIAANAVHDCKDDIEAIWKLLMRDDLVAFYTKAMAKTDIKTVEMEKQLVERIARNVTTLNSRFTECIPMTKTLDDDNDEVCDKRVRDLINWARNPDSLCMMSGNYQAWL
jgi:phosphatidylinositol kinase/protein kinase (PI-3  family)